MNLSEKIPTRFETSRLLIRRYQQGDEQSLYQAARASISEVFRFLPWCHPDYDIEDSRKWLEITQENWAKGEGFSFGIFSHDGNDYFGGCGINLIDEHPVGNLGYWIRSSATGQGIATEATKGLLQFAFAHLDLQRIEIVMSVENGASQQVAEAAGGQYEGRMKNRLMLHGKAHDAHLYAVIPEDLNKD